MIINEERLRSAINTGSVRTAASETLAEFDQLTTTLSKQPRNEVDINNAVSACRNKLNALIGSIGEISNPEPLPQPQVTEDSEVPVTVPLESEVSE